MINRHKPDVHIRYLIGTSLLLIGSGLDRALLIFGDIPFPMAVTIVFSVAKTIAVLCLFNDLRTGSNIKPLLTIIILLISNHFRWGVRESAIWQKIPKWVVSITF